MKILILGNGFDLACGLPTSYNEFFEWRFNKIKEIYGNIESLFDNYRDNFYKPVIEIKMIGNVKSDPLRLAEVDTNEGRKSYRTIYDELRDIMNNMKDKQINFFDLYFVLNKKNKVNWNDIESEIYAIVTDIGNYNTKKSEDQLNKIIPGGNAYKNNAKLENITIYNLFLLMFMEQCKVENNLNIYEVLLKELKKFETEFQKYISEINSKIVDRPTLQRTYIENCRKLIKFESNTYIINFNYTSIEKILENQQYTHTPKEINVHGRYDQVTIFGIDQSVCKVDTDEYIFTKTYRKIAENTNSIMLPEKKGPRIEEQELVFYGHSLAKADYSYFQSLFDLYDVYNQTFLTFKYSIYDEEKTYEIKQDVFHKVTKLLIDYGSTMSNKDHGKNLLHKILLEGRLKVEVVVLNNMKYE
jgi:hypothetical protein